MLAAPPSALVSQPRRGTGRAASGDDGSVGLAAAAPAVSDAAVALITRLYALRKAVLGFFA